MSKEGSIYNCIVTTYEGYTDYRYLSIIKSIIKDIQIQHIYYLSLKFHPTNIGNANLVNLIHDLIINRRAINEFNKKFFNGKLFIKQNKFVAQKDNPFITLSRISYDNISLMEHSPVDSTLRIARNNGITLNKTKSSISFFHRAKIKIINLLLSAFYPLSFSFEFSNNGYTWFDWGDNFYYLDYRKIQQTISLKDMEEINASSSRVLFMIDHPDMFRDVKNAREEVEGLDFIKMYQDILSSHVDSKEIVICKFHPYITQNSSELKINKYIDDIKSSFNSIGYKNIFFLHEIIFNETYKSYWPVEMLINALKIKKVVGVYSSTMLIMQNWDGIRVISDCTHLKYFRDARERDRLVFPISFECYP